MTKLVHHDIDGHLEFENLSIGFDFDLLGQVTTSDRLGNEGNTSYLVGKIGSETIDDILELLPCSFDAVHLSLTTELALGSYFERDTSDFGGEMREAIDHLIDDILEFDHDVTCTGTVIC